MTINRLKAFYLLIFRHERYIDVAVQHLIDLNLQEPDQRARHEQGKIDLEQWGASFALQSKDAGKALRKAFWSAFLYIAIGAIVAISAGVLAGAIHPNMDISYTHSVSFVGTFLAGWATLMELGNIPRTWGGCALHEVLHPFMFKLLFVPGVCLLMLGVVL